MTALLESLSNELASAVEAGGGAVVAIHARRRIPASGVHWRQGVIVATNHTIQRDDNITVTLPDGTSAPVALCRRIRDRAGAAGTTAHGQLGGGEQRGRRVAHLAGRRDRLAAPSRCVDVRRILGRPPH